MASHAAIFFRTVHGGGLATFSCDEGLVLEYPYPILASGALYCINGSWALPIGINVKSPGEANADKELTIGIIQNHFTDKPISRSSTVNNWFTTSTFQYSTQWQYYFDSHVTRTNSIGARDFMFVPDNVTLHCNPKCDRDCKPHGYCDASTGKCKCYKGFTGDKCNVTGCTSSHPAVGFSIVAAG